MDDISHPWDINETSAQSAGGIASLVVASSGAGFGGIQTSGVGLAGNAGLQLSNSVSYKADPSGAVPVGMLLQDIIVPSDPNRYFENYQKSAIAVPGEKVTLIRKGWLVTDKIQGTPTAGAKAYLAPSGKVTPTAGGNDAYPQVGKFETIKDEAGFARVFIDL